MHLGSAASTLPEGADGDESTGRGIRTSGPRRLARWLLIGSGALACLVAPSVASASTITGGPNPKITAGAGEQNQIVLSGTASNTVITDTAGITLAGAPECTQDTANQVSCDGGIGNWQFLTLSLGDLDDQVTAQPMAPGWGVVANGGSGADRLDFSGLAALDTLGPSGGGKITVEAWGGAGNDTLIGSKGANMFDNPSEIHPDPSHDAGDDSLTGGPMADYLVGGQGTDSIDGGDGADLIFGVVINKPSLAKTEDARSDTLFCGPGAVDPNTGVSDVVYAGAGDRVGIDCEFIDQLIVCPKGAECAGTPKVTTTVPIRGKQAGTAKAKRKQVVLGRSLGGKVRLRPGGTRSVYILLRKKPVNRALGKRSQMAVTFSQNLDRIKSGRKVGKANRSKRFKMQRR